ncbi:MAG: hypothetical protein K0Q72_3963 [Armatimonadetes bacterium]|nr:hypothetical protein [Armatimonadota bacterium]
MTDDDTVEQLILKLRDRNWETATRAQKALVKLGQAAVEPLCEGLLDADVQLAWRAAWVLGRIGDPAAVGPLGEVVSPPVGAAPALSAPSLRTYEDRRALLRAEAAEALGWFHHPGVVGPLCRALADPYPTIREKAGKALCSQGPYATGQLCARMLELPPQGAVLAATALAAVGDASAIRPLCTALGDRHWSVKRAAAMALSAIAERHPVSELRAAIPPLRRNLSVWPVSPAELRPATERALRIIEELTHKLQAVPLPASPPEADTASLPRPADAQLLPDGSTYATAAPGWRGRLREWLRR